MKITRSVVPSLFTVLNMFCGFISITHAGRGEFMPASWFIILAAGFDALDGIMARITRSSSQFGVEIDSLSDVISFGVAPAFLAYQLYLNELGGIGIFLSSLLMVLCGLRLARFNVHLVGFDKDHYVGLPAPASALTVASFTLNYWNSTTGLGGAAIVLPYMVIVLGLLMISKVKYDTLPKFSKRTVQKEPWKYVFFGLAVVVVFVTGGTAIFPLFVLFITLGIVRYLGGTIKHLMRSDQKLEEEESVEPRQIDT